MTFTAGLIIVGTVAAIILLVTAKDVMGSS